MITATVIGATGMVGSSLIKLLMADARFEKILVFTRRSLKLRHNKLEEHIIDFDSPGTWKRLVRGNILFSTLGTTLKQAGSKSAQFKIDYTYQLDFAKAAATNSVSTYVLVSSASASPESKIFYSKMKGELERDVKQLPFQSVSILQPSLLAGKRVSERMGEKLGFHVLYFLNALGLFRKYRPVHADIVAKAMLNAALQARLGLRTYSLDEIFFLAGERAQEDRGR